MIQAEVDGTQRELTKAPALCSQRWNLATLAFFGFLFIYIVRVNLSGAITCMIRSNYTNLFDGTLSSNDTSILSNLEIKETSGDGPLPAEATGKKCAGDMRQNIMFFSSHEEFYWDKVIKSRLLSMYFYGYIVTQIPGGWLAERYGGRKVWGVSQLIGAVCMLLTPVGAHFSDYLVYALRFILGLTSGVSFPCVHTMMGQWAPKLERSKLLTFSFAGPPLGTIVALFLSALFCSYGLDNGWGFIFYIAGAGNLLWLVVWVFCTADTPSQDKRISSKERDYIISSIGEKQDTKDKLTTPWLALLLSRPLWAVMCAHVCNNYTGYTLLTSLPTFMKEVLKFDIKQSPTLSALPYLCQAITSVIAGQVADLLREQKILTTTTTRKVYSPAMDLIQIVTFGCVIPQSRDLEAPIGEFMAFLGMAICIGATGFLTCEQRFLAFVIICLCLAFMGINRAGYAINHIDLSPRHAGILVGITNSVATIPGIIAPLVEGALTPNNTVEEWRTVFYICSALATFGALIFGFFADGEAQHWGEAVEETICYEVTIKVTVIKTSRLSRSSREPVTLDAIDPEPSDNHVMDSAAPENVDSEFSHL